MTEQEKWTNYILNRLLDTYEKSSYRKTGVYSRRILFYAAKTPELMRKLEFPDEKQTFFAVLSGLKEQGMVDYSWMRFEEGNLVELIWLNPDKDAIRRAYDRISRIPAEDRVRQFATDVEATLAAFSVGMVPPESARARQPQESSLSREPSLQRESAGFDGGLQEEQTDHIRSYLEELRTIALDRQRIPAPFTGDSNLDRNLLLFLRYLAENREPEMERVISARLYGDSKYFEHHLKTKAGSILRRIEKEKAEGRTDPDAPAPSDDEILLHYGISRWPEIFAFRGNLSAEMDDGKGITFGSPEFGAYTDSETVRHMVRIHLGETKTVLFIENRANYEWAVQHIPAGKSALTGKPGNAVRHEAVDATSASGVNFQTSLTDPLLAHMNRLSYPLALVYHGGFYSPAKGKFFRLIREACTEGVRFFHWSDIDAGGFRIFKRLKENIIPDLQPFMMDERTLQHYETAAMPIKDEKYLQLLQQMRTDERFQCFHALIDLMLERKIRLEQENEISS